MKKRIALFLSIIMLLGLIAGCGKKATSNGTAPVDGTTAPGGSGQESTKPGEQEGEDVPEDAAGSLLINADVIVTIYYDADGSVVKAEGNNLAGAELLDTYNELTRSPCAEVVTKIIKDGHAQNSEGNINSVIVKQNRGSANPEENFMTQIKSAAETALKDVSSKAQLFLIPVEELTNGSIPLKYTKDLVLNFLGVSAVESIMGAETPASGYYMFDVVYDGNEEVVHINAATGAVGFGTVDDPTDGEAEDAITDPKETRPTEVPEETTTESTPA